MRRKAREAALQALFQIDVGKAAAHEAVAYAINLNDLSGETEEFCRSLVDGVVANRDSIDATIERLAIDWSLSRLGNVDRNVLRMALFELVYRQDIPVGVTINEAVEVAKTFGNSESGRFINGILGRFARENLGEIEGER